MIIRIAFRNIIRNYRRSAITLLVIASGSIGLILFGGYKELTFRGLRESTIRGRVGHLQIYKAGHSSAESAKVLEYGLEDVTALRREVEKDPRVQSTAAQITLMGLISNGEKSETFMATAVEPEQDKKMKSRKLLSGTDLSVAAADSVLLGKGLANSMHAKVGDYITLMTTTATGSLNAADVQVAGIFSSGVKEYDDRAVTMTLSSAQQLLQSTRVERLLVFLKETEDTGAMKSALATRFSTNGWKLEMKEWSELASFYHQVVMLYNGIFGFIGFVVFGVVVFSVANTITMSIFERMREVGTLMAIGTTRNRIWRMFVTEGIATGILGGIAGIVGGLLFAQIINNGNIMMPPPPGYTVGYKLAVLVKSDTMIFAFLVSVITATISSVLPALRASRMKIVDALGHI